MPWAWLLLLCPYVCMGAVAPCVGHTHLLSCLSRLLDWPPLRRGGFHPRSPCIRPNVVQIKDGNTCVLFNKCTQERVGRIVQKQKGRKKVVPSVSSSRSFVEGGDLSGPLRGEQILGWWMDLGRGHRQWGAHVASYGQVVAGEQCWGVIPCVFT